MSIADAEHIESQLQSIGELSSEEREFIEEMMREVAKIAAAKEVSSLVESTITRDLRKTFQQILPLVRSAESAARSYYRLYNFVAEDISDATVREVTAGRITAGRGRRRS